VAGEVKNLYPTLIWIQFLEWLVYFYCCCFCREICDRLVSRQVCERLVGQWCLFVRARLWYFEFCFGQVACCHMDDSLASVLSVSTVFFV